MSQDVEQRIRDRAYAIWQEKGCPEGSDHEHWFLAEQEIAGTIPPNGTDQAEASHEAPARKAAGKKTAVKTDAAKTTTAVRKPRAGKVPAAD